MVFHGANQYSGKDFLDQISRVSDPQADELASFGDVL